MTDSTMVERLALVFAQHGDHFFGNDGPSSASWDDFSPRERLVATAAARAAIEAMMEPTPAMIGAGRAADWVGEVESRAGLSIMPDTTEDYSAEMETTIRRPGIWQAMLSEALRSSLKGEGE